MSQEPEWVSRPTLESVTLLSFTPTTTLTVGSGVNTIHITAGQVKDARTGRALPAIVDWAETLSQLRSPDIQDCERLVANYNEREELSQYIIGTAMLSHAIKKYKSAMNVWIRRGCIVQSQKAMDVASRPWEGPLPTRMHRLHRPNELIVGRSNSIRVRLELPPLTADWKAYFEKINEQGLNVKQTLKHYPKTSSTCLPNTFRFKYFTHPTYGQYGCSNKALKKRFRVTVRAGLDDKVTHSVCHPTDHIHAVLPRWNRHAGNTLLWMCSERLGAQPTDSINLEIMSGYLSEATDAIIALLEEYGLQICTDEPSAEPFERWVASATQFPVAKLLKYLKAYLEATDKGHLKSPKDIDFRHKAHPKNESYAAGNKAQRAILAGNYQAAVVMAPICDIIGSAFFGTKYTSKKIPETERPKQAKLRFEGPVILNDMSAFEGSITSDIKRLVEQRVFKHFFPKYGEYIDQYVKSDIHVRVDRVSAVIPNCRCSGDPQTSLGNSLTNLASIVAAIRYSQERRGVHKTAIEVLRDLHVWVEGDDSLVSLSSVTDGDEIPADYTRAFELMGFATKMELKGFVGDAGYCSMYFNRDGLLIPSVSQTLLDFPWNHNPHNNIDYDQLLNLKAQSIAASSPGAPILSSLYNRYARRDLRISIPFNAYEAEEYARQGFEVLPGRGTTMIVVGRGKVVPMAVSEESRRLFAEKYGISMTDQIMIESIIEKKSLDKIPEKFIQKMCEVDGIDFSVCVKMYRDCCDSAVSRPAPSPIDTGKDYHRDRSEDSLVVIVDGRPSTVNKDYLPSDRLSDVKNHCDEMSRIMVRHNAYMKKVRKRHKIVRKKLRWAKIRRVISMTPVYIVLTLMSLFSPVSNIAVERAGMWTEIHPVEWVLFTLPGVAVHGKIFLNLISWAINLLGTPPANH